MATNRYLIITSGPTGSGKTELVKATLQYLHERGDTTVDKDTRFQKFLIDDLVENSKNYQDGVEKIIEGVKKKCEEEKKRKVITDNTDKITGCEKNKYSKNDGNLIDAFFKAYESSIKEDPGCNQKNTKYITQAEQEQKVYSGLSCYDVLDKKLKSALNNPKENPVVVFETTGKSIPKWLLSYVTGETGFIPEISQYKVIFSYSLVSVQNLIIRNQNRFVGDLTKYYDNRTENPTPRLPYNTECAFMDNNNRIIVSTMELFNECIKDKNTETCGDVPINRLLLFDNNEQIDKRKKGQDPIDTYKIKYDSVVDSDVDEGTFRGILEKSLLNENDKCVDTRKRKYSQMSERTGGKKRTLRKRRKNKKK